MANVGIHPETGEIITGWDRTIQGLITCIETEKGERVQHRDFGGELEAMVDRSQNMDEVTNAFVRIQAAIEPRLVNGYWYGEPCFGLVMIRADLSTPGKPMVELVGVEFPNGHLGDFTTTGERVSVTLPMEDIL